jgi:hypothetical protein
MLGRWVYSIQGLMQFTNPTKWGVDPQSTLEYGWAIKDDANYGSAQHATLGGFSPIPLAVFTRPPFADMPDPPPNQMLPAPRQSPDPLSIPLIAGYGAQTVPPISGYLPYTECGYIEFADDGTLVGQLFFTVAGASPNFPNSYHVSGRFKFNDKYHRADGRVWPIGAMSFVFVGEGEPNKFVWDYSVIMTSSDEAQIMTIGRLARPATAAGTMKRADWEALRWEAQVP